MGLEPATASTTTRKTPLAPRAWIVLQSRLLFVGGRRPVAGPSCRGAYWCAGGSDVVSVLVVGRLLQARPAAGGAQTK
jgi:hypothetical protein